MHAIERVSRIAQGGMFRGRGWIALGLGLALSSVGVAQEERKIGEMVLSGVPDWDVALEQRLSQYNQARSATLQSISDDGASILVTTRFGETAQLHVVEQAGGMRRQLTFFEEPIGNAMFVPGSNGRRIVFSKDVGGNEKDQFYLLDRDAGTTRLLTDPAGRHAAPLLSRDGRFLYYTGTARNGRDFDVYRVGLGSSPPPASETHSSMPTRYREALGSEPTPPELLWEVSGAFYATDISPDGKQLVVLNYRSASDTSLFVLDVESKQAEQITPTEPAHFYGKALWSADQSGIYTISDRGGDQRQLFFLERATDEWRSLSADLRWDVEDFVVHPVRKGAVAFVTNEDGISKMHTLSGNPSSRVTLGEGVPGDAPLPVGVIGSLGRSADGATLGFTLNSSRSTGDVYILNEQGGPTRWTFSEVGGLDTGRFIEPQLVRVPTFDEVNGQRRTVPAFYYPAPHAGKRPIVIYAHGGPESQFRPSFVSLFQYWAQELGISVLAPNIRGSTGYGRAYHQLDNGRLREDALKDIGALLDWVEEQPELDSERVGIFGGSYGGYVVLGSMAMFPDRIKAGVDIVGIASFVTFLENTGDFRRELRRVEYGDESDPEMRAFLEEISPLNRAERITGALFVLHGKNDPRVPYTEAEQIVQRLRDLGRPVWYALALNEGHGFAKRENRDLTRVLYAHFWQETLLKGMSSEDPMRAMSAESSSTGDAAIAEPTASRE